MPNSKLFYECLVLASTLLCIVAYTITNKKSHLEDTIFESIYMVTWLYPISKEHFALGIGR